MLTRSSKVRVVCASAAFLVPLVVLSSIYFTYTAVLLNQFPQPPSLPGLLENRQVTVTEVQYQTYIPDFVRVREWKTVTETVVAVETVTETVAAGEPTTAAAEVVTELVTVKETKTVTSSAVETKLVELEKRATATRTAYIPAGTGMPPHCDDPYRRPGFLHIPFNETDFPFQQSKYVPYYDELIDRKEPGAARYPDYDLTDAPDMSFPAGTIDEELIEQAPIDWIEVIRLYLSLLDSPENFTDSEITATERKVSWLRNKRLLMLADSVDRYMMHYFCEELDVAPRIAVLGMHTTSECHIPQLNFTILHWHIASMYTHRPKWWWAEHMSEVAFEKRNQELFMSRISADRATDVIGMNGRGPDLILYQSMLWDWTTMTTKHKIDNGLDVDTKAQRKARAGKGDKLQKNKTKPTEKTLRPFHWSEIDFYRARQKKFIEFYRSIFGPETPFMFRAAMQTKYPADTTVPLRQLDRMGRYVAHSMDVEVFEWGQMIAGYAYPYYSAYKDEVHPKRGPHTYIYSNMMLYYLFRASGGAESRGQVVRWPAEANMTTGEAWEECHGYNMRMTM
ncbi:hypothetical protein BZA70DRAFT_272096 [Myxozyma melibiosi]|uniref:Uncharacterized protein n=1 Tax=Myxozyma melibiosi TaxID=54550 RepID=A0ABR1FFF9_9ASCO